jgi:hypothetical protein
VDKRSSLLRKFVNYGQKSFITLTPGRREAKRNPDEEADGREEVDVGDVFAVVLGRLWTTYKTFLDL